MLSLAQLSHAVNEYRAGAISLDAFEDWFRDHSRSMFGESRVVLDACVDIEAAFSMIRYDGVSEAAFRDELAKVIQKAESGNRRQLLDPERVAS